MAPSAASCVHLKQEHMEASGQVLEDERANDPSGACQFHSEPEQPGQLLPVLPGTVEQTHQGELAKLRKENAELHGQLQPNTVGHNSLSVDTDESGSGSTNPSSPSTQTTERSRAPKAPRSTVASRRASMASRRSSLSSMAAATLDYAIGSTFTKIEEHPLIIHAPEVRESIKFVRLAFFQQLLIDRSVLLPRCQDLPKEAFGELTAKCVLVSISHGWFFQCHPDPLGDKCEPLLAMLNSLRSKYPLSEILVFFDFLSISQRPYKLGQSQRTEEMQAMFAKALSNLHFCYCYSDAVIHLHSDPPMGDTPLNTTTTDMTKFELAQVGRAIQVVGLHGKETKDGLNAFDIISKIDGREVSRVEEVPSCEVEVGYFKLPFGKTNLIPVNDRGWVFLERFITMLKAAMIDDDDFDDCIFTNSDATRAILHDGALRLREAAQGDDSVLREVLEGFKNLLQEKQFSAASTDKIIIDQAQACSQDGPSDSKLKSSAGFKACDDAQIVAGLMDELVELFGKSWYLEQNKQQELTSRIKVDVPLLILTPHSCQEAFQSCQPVMSLAALVLGACVVMSVVVAIAMIVLGVDHKWGDVHVCYLLSVASSVVGGISFFLISPAHDLRMPASHLFLKYYFPVLVTAGAANAGALTLAIAAEPEWRSKRAHVWLCFIFLGALIVCVKTADCLAVWESPVLQAAIQRGARQLPHFCKRFIKGIKFGFMIGLFAQVIFGYIIACVALRAIINQLSPPVSAGIVISANALKQGIMYSYASVLLPRLPRVTFASVDSSVFAFNTLLTFGTRLLVTAVSSTTIMFAMSLLCSFLDLGASRVVLYLTHREVRRLEALVQSLDEKHQRFNPLAQKQNDKAKLLDDAMRHLLQARRKLATEVITLMNDLFVELYCTGTAAICGVIFRSSSAVTLLDSELSLDQLPIFLAVQFVPEIIDGYLIVVYLTYLGVDWLQLASDMCANSLLLSGKAAALVSSLLLAFLAAVGSD